MEPLPDPAAGPESASGSTGGPASLPPVAGAVPPGTQLARWSAAASNSARASAEVVLIGSRIEGYMSVYGNNRASAEVVLLTGGAGRKEIKGGEAGSL